PSQLRYTLFPYTTLFRSQALNALASSVAMSSLGKNGVIEMSKLNMQKARYAREQFAAANIPVVFEGSIFNEFVIKLSVPVSEVNNKLIEKGIVGGFDLGFYYPELENHMLVAVTEIRTKEQIDTFVQELGDING